MHALENKHTPDGSGKSKYWNKALKHTSGVSQFKWIDQDILAENALHFHDDFVFTPALGDQNLDHFLLLSRN